MYKETLERRIKSRCPHSIELRVSYLDLDVVNLAMSIDPRLKILEGDTLGKHVHREAAESLRIFPGGLKRRLSTALAFIGR